MVGGKPETFVCMFVVAQEGSDSGPSRICRSNDPLDLKRKMQVHHWLPLAVQARFWVADAGLATRIEKECRRVLDQHQLRGGWFGLAPSDAAHAIVQASSNLRIPILRDDEYRKLIPTKDQNDEILLRQAGATTGGLRAA
jgi:hypothetical protein